MSNIIDLKKGLNIPISGVAALEAKKTIVPSTLHQGQKPLAVFTAKNP